MLSFPDLKNEFSFPTQYSTVIFVGLSPQSIYAIPFRIFWTQNYEFRWPNIKIWVQFSGFIFWGKDLEIIHEQNQKLFKVPKVSKIVPYCPNVSWGNVFGKVFLIIVPWIHRKFSKNSKKNSKLQKCPRSFPKMSKLVLNMFCGNFFRKKNAPCSMEGRVFEKFQKNQKRFNFQKMPLIVSKSVQTCFEQALGWCFWNSFAQCSMQCISGFLDWKSRVQFSETILNRHSFYIHATVNIPNPISEFLDLKLWLQIPEHKNMSSVFRT